LKLSPVGRSGEIAVAGIAFTWKLAWPPPFVVLWKSATTPKFHDDAVLSGGAT